ncbi:response regulator [Planctomycetota bacterium]
MQNNVAILITEDDENHFELIRKNLLRAGIYNEMVRLRDGRELLDFLFDKQKRVKYGQHYILLLDLVMPGVDGLAVLEQLKNDKKLSKIPVIILTAADAPATVERCGILGCSSYLVKPESDKEFADMTRKIGRFLSVVEIPSIK